jgi:nitrogen regulatory protein PII
MNIKKEWQMVSYGNFQFVGKQPTSLIGRQDDIAAVKEKLLKDDVHLLTLVGVAGVGKTRLALAAAKEMKANFVQIIFVDLAATTETSQVLPAIAEIEVTPAALIAGGVPGCGALGAWPGVAVLTEPTGIITSCPCAVKLIVPSTL